MVLFINYGEYNSGVNISIYNFFPACFMQPVITECCPAGVITSSYYQYLFTKILLIVENVFIRFFKIEAFMFMVSTFLLLPKTGGCVYFRRGVSTVYLACEPVKNKIGYQCVIQCVVLNRSWVIQSV